jgi:probable rRNA maturation factor
MALEVRFHATAPLPPDLNAFPDEALTALLRSEGIPDEGTIYCVLTNDDELASLNERFRGGIGPTDVLAFPYDPAKTGGIQGDIYVSIDQARTQSSERGELHGREVIRLFAHGALHLAGYDHDTKARDQAMRARQEAWVERLYARSVDAR